MSAEAGLAAAGGGVLTAEFALTHGAVILGMAFLAASTGIDVHSIVMHSVVEPAMGI